MRLPKPSGWWEGARVAAPSPRITPPNYVLFMFKQIMIIMRNLNNPNVTTTVITTGRSVWTSKLISNYLENRTDMYNIEMIPLCCDQSLLLL